jgi:DNA-binding beta-propeller fold protein YncE
VGERARLNGQVLLNQDDKGPVARLGGVPAAVAIDPAAGTIYTANGDNTVSIIPAIR